MEDKDVSALKSKIEKVDHVSKVIWYDSFADLSVPKDMLPESLYDAFNNDEKNATMMVSYLMIPHRRTAQWMPSRR